jgi:hypothetical protein
MKNPPTFVRFLFLLISLGAIIYFVAGVKEQNVAALAVNGKIAFTSSNLIHTINPDGSGVLQLTPFGNGFTDHSPAWSPDGDEDRFQPSDLYSSGADLRDECRRHQSDSNYKQLRWRYPTGVVA